MPLALRASVVTCAVYAVEAASGALGVSLAVRVGLS